MATMGFWRASSSSRRGKPGWRLLGQGRSKLERLNANSHRVPVIPNLIDDCPTARRVPTRARVLYSMVLAVSGPPNGNQAVAGNGSKDSSFTFGEILCSGPIRVHKRRRHHSLGALDQTGTNGTTSYFQEVAKELIAELTWNQPEPTLSSWESVPDRFRS